MDVSDALKKALMSMWQAPQTALGTAVGMARTGGLPSVQQDPEGNDEYVFRMPEGASPQAMGQTLMLPPNTSDTDLAHERVHTEQSRRYGPAYLPINMFASILAGGSGDLEHAMEDEAYLRTEAPGSQNLSDRLSMKLATKRK